MAVTAKYNLQMSCLANRVDLFFLNDFEIETI